MSDLRKCGLRRIDRTYAEILVGWVMALGWTFWPEFNIEERMRFAAAGGEMPGTKS